MAWTDPFTAAAGAIFTAAQWNQYGRDNLNYLKGIADGATISGCAVQRNAATSIANDAWTEITFSTENLDLGGWFTSGTDVIVPAGAIPPAFTTIACKYTLQGEWASDATGIRAMRILVNGTPISTYKGPSLSGDTTTIDGSSLLFGLAAAAVITLEVYQNSGGNLDISNTNLAVMRYAPQA